MATAALAPGRTGSPATYPDCDDHTEAAPAVRADPEARLRTAAVAGDRAAFAALYASYHDTVLQYLTRRCRGDRHLAEDLTQDTFTRAFSRLHGYRETGRSFAAWLVTIAGNLLADHWRSGWHRRMVAWGDFTGDTREGRILVPQDTGADPAIEVVSWDRRQHLARILAGAVARLSRRQQEVVSLRYGRGLSVAATARALGLDEGAVKAASYRARRALACDPRLEELR